MSVLEKQTLDMAALLAMTDDLGQSILRSVEVADYSYWKQQVQQDEAAKAVLRKMAKAKERFEECERFGHFHPNYHEALEAVKAVEKEMEAVPSLARYKHAEAALDMLLLDVSETIAHAVSESVKVPSNNPLPKSSGGCGSGGSCGCG